MIPVFYRPEMSATNSDSFSPSAAKPKIVVDHWLAQGAISPAQITSFEPAHRYTIGLAHDQEYVDNVLDCQTPNGFGNRSPEVAASLPYTAGSMMAAALHVLDHGGLACSPTSGFHHAGFDFGGGFCTFNALAVAAIKAAKSGAKVGILDCDAHYGDGTADILRLHKKLGIKHHTFGEHFPCGKEAKGWEMWLLKAINDLSDCDVVLYQAGADPYLKDPLGGQMSMMHLSYRDSLVFSMLDNVAWNFAGGYTRDADGGISPVIAIHTATLREATFQQQSKASA
jgi:acetoin utilization deacetylase AcuC-like enzyme